MKYLFSILLIFVSICFVNCASNEKKKDLTIKGSRVDSGITVKDSSFKFENIKKVILYNEINDEESNMILYGIAASLFQKGIEAVIDTGETMEYKDENLRIKTYKNLMSVYYNLVILKPNQQKGNEDVIADIKADSIPKLVENTVQYILN